ncbi:phosphatase PAP2 family protein [Dongia soli]|uniref:Phosphatase PAP2 family protein n=1 Tax=Dongia soli TaxID=600628 RepID=A0ABU5E9G0_9PROT|nr:phosphatase PAP2 family protein [Dongia soli]MDY0882833.1 phosphatase PAP2 family protein [Dongia soli]
MNDLFNPRTAFVPSAGLRKIEAGNARRYLYLLKKSCRENSLLICISAIYYFFCAAIQKHYDTPISPLHDIGATYISVLIALALSCFCVFALWFLYLKRIKRQPDLLTFVGKRLRDDYLSASRLMLALPVLLIWPVFVSSFSYLKVLIPIFKPYVWDVALMTWDQRLHFGRLPWEWLDPLFGHTISLFVLNWTYTVWFLAMMTALLLQVANMRNRRLRAQYLLAQTILWPLMGNLVAMILSSAGPCYFGQLNPGADPYAGQMAHLHTISQSLGFSIFGTFFHVPLTALSMQTHLWNGYTSGRFEAGLGISAAPSLHVASSWLIARLCSAYGRRAAVCGFIFLALIFIASIELGWHYAIDGYLGMFGAWCCWRLAGGILSLTVVKRLLWGIPRNPEAETIPASQ